MRVVKAVVIVVTVLVVIGVIRWMVALVEADLPWGAVLVAALCVWFFIAGAVLRA